MQQLSNLDKYRYICKDLPSPEIFIDFNFYFLIASCLARKVWVGTEDSWPLFPNLYILISADPGLGKSLPSSLSGRILNDIVEIVKGEDGKLVRKNLLYVAPDTTSWEKLIYNSARSGDICKRIDKADTPTYYHCSTCFCLGDEVKTLFRKNTEDITTFLTKSWDCREYKNDTHKHGLQWIKNICVNFLGCCTPEDLGKLLDTGLFDSGLTARMLFLYHDQQRPDKPALLNTTPEQEEAKKLLSVHLKNLCCIPASELKYTPESLEWIEAWHKKNYHLRAGLHPRLKDYYARKKQHIIKLAISCHFADKMSYEIAVEDLEAAELLLKRMEQRLPEALNTGSKNPLALMSQNMTKYINFAGGTVSRRKLLLEFWREGNEKDMNETIEFMIGVGEWTNTTIDNKPGVMIVKK